MAVNSRFAEVSEGFLESLIENSIPAKTNQATKYGMKIFIGKERNRKPYFINKSAFICRSRVVK